MLRQRKKPNFVIWLFVTILITSSSYVDAKRSWTSNNRKPSGGYNTHRKPSTSSGYGVTKPGSSRSSSSHIAHPDPKVFSYSNTAPKTPAAAPPPIGWNVGHNQGPPPAYSGVNPSGGAKTSIHEKPPPYNPSYVPPQRNTAPVGSGHIGSSGSSSPGSSSNSGSTINRAATPVLHNRATNSTGAFGSGGHTPLSPTHVNNQQSSYPRQQPPVQTVPGQHMGGVNYQPGSQPVGGYYPSPPGYHQPGALPPGGNYYHQPGGSYYPPPGHYPPPAGLPAGGTYIPSNAPLPQGAIILSEPPKSSSGLGFGSGAIIGAVGGAILGHALTPTHTRVIEHGPVNSNPGNSGANDDKIIIINNGPPGSVTTQDAGSGTTVITTGQQAVPGAPSQSGVPAPQPIPPQSQPMAPAPPSQPIDSSAGAPLAPLQPVPSATNDNTPLAPFGSSQPPSQDQTAPPANVGNSPVQQPSLYCAEYLENDTNGNPVTKTYCFPTAAQPQAPAASTGAAGATETTPTPPAPGNGMVPLAPMNHQSTPDLMKNPGGEDKVSTARLSESSMIKTASGAESQKVSKGFIYSTLLIFLSAYCLH